MADRGLTIRSLGPIAAALARMGQRLYRTPGETITGVDPSHWPSASQPVQPIGPPGSEPMGFPYWYGQNLNYTPRSDSPLLAIDLRRLSTYPLARVCIENTKDQLCQMPWKVQLRQLPGESKSEVAARRKREQKGDPNIKRVSQFLEYPDGEHDWSDWLRPLLEDMLVIDAASILVRKTYNDQLAELRVIPGDNIARYIDDNGFTPAPPSPAYAQLWEGIPRVNLTSDQLMYKPRNIVPRDSISSYMYGYSPCEQVAQEIQIGIARMNFVQMYYEKGSIGNVIQVVPPKVNQDRIKEAQQYVNSEMSGNLAARRQWRMVQGFKDDGSDDQIIFPKEPVLADVFDDLHIRKVCYAFGASPQRLMRMMNRASAQVSQQSAEDEGIRPWMIWVAKSVAGPVIARMTGTTDYEMVMSLVQDADELKQAKTDDIRTKGGHITINEVREEQGWDPSDDQAASELAITTPTGRIPIGQAPPTLVQRGDPTPAVRPNGKAAH